MAQVWFVTGSSRGLGRAIVEAGLLAGNKVLATARDIESLRELSERYGDQVKLFELDVTGRDRRVVGCRCGEDGNRCVWLAGRCYQQCRIWQSLVRRRHTDIGFPRTDRNQSLRDNHRDEGSSPVLSRKEGGPFRSVFLDGRKDRTTRARALFGGEMGRRRFLRSFVARSGAARHQGDDRRAGWLPHGLRRQFHQAKRRASRIRLDCWSNGQVSARL